MSPIIKRYSICSLLIVGIVLYIFYSHIGANRNLGHFNTENLIDIGFTQLIDENDDEYQIDERILVNLNNFEFKIKPECLWKNVNEPILGIIIITTYVGHDAIRSAHRSAISYNDLQRLGFLRVFLLAEIPSKEKFITQEAISSESRHFNDIVQGNFIEAYRNLTYKHVMGLKWAASQPCNIKPRFIIKMDDDIVVDYFYLSNYLQNHVLHNIVHNTAENYLAGFLLHDVKPIRLRQNKWYVSHAEYNMDLYPDYLSGWMYVTIPHTARRLVRAAAHAMPPFFWIDDTWITGVLRTNAHLTINETWNDLYSANSQFIDCCINDMQQFRYRCPFIAGPNGGDHKLITTFLQTYRRQCYTDKADNFVPVNNICKARPDDRPPLIKSCIGADKHLLKEDHGAAVVNTFKL